MAHPLPSAGTQSAGLDGSSTFLFSSKVFPDVPFAIPMFISCI